MKRGPCPARARTRRHDCNPVVHGPFLIGAIQLRLPVARLVHAGLPLIGHDQPRGPVEEGQRARMRADPIRQPAGPGGFGVGVVAGAEHGHEHECRAI